MKRKKVKLTVSIPFCYRWVAVQPWGEIVAFMSKPVIYRAVEDREGDFVPCYWRDKNNLLNAEISLISSDAQQECKNWRKTRRAI